MTVDNFKYVESTVSSIGNTNLEAYHRVHVAWINWARIFDILSAKSPSVSVEVKANKTIVRPVCSKE